jgi:CubicO group peptidase (beta-lactamase class C family)
MMYSQMRIFAVFIFSISLAVSTHAQQVPGGPVFNFDTAVHAAGKMPRLYGLLVSHKGERILEQYFNGSGPEKIVNVKSVSKSVISALVGIAIAEGHIRSTDETLADYFPERLNNEQDQLRQDISVRNLLTMQAGLASTSSRNYGAWVQSKDWIDYALKQPLLAPPGTLMQYSTGNTLLSAILTRSTGMSTLEFARRVLGEPLGFQLASWPKDPQGIYFGGNDMEMTGRQMLAFGELYLKGGKVNGQQVIPAEWVKNSLQRHAESTREHGRYYGYGWWIHEMAGFETQYAWGYGGQFIILVPALELVVVTTSSSHPDPERRTHRQGVDELIESHIISVVAAGTEQARLSINQ